MIEEYQHLIYENDEEKERVQQSVFEETLNCNKEYTVQQGSEAIQSHDKSEFDYDYVLTLMRAEGEMLFDKAVKMFGEPLWNGHAWQNKSCRARCPFGDMCRKELVAIEDNILCFGQLYKNNIDDEKLIRMSRSKRIKIINSDGSVHIDLSKEFDIQALSWFFFKHTSFIWHFGDYELHKDRVNGINVISLL